MKIYNLKNGVFQYYKKHVAENESVTIKEAQRKLTRNVILAAKADSVGYKDQLYKYGRLWIWVNGNNIVGLKNRCPREKGWTKDKVKYLELNKQLGISEDVSMMDLHRKDLQIWAKKVLFKIRRWFKS